MIKVSINNICAKLAECEPLTSGMIGKTIEVEFSAEWAGLSKTAVFSNGDITIDVLESQWNGNTITIPHEVLAVPNRTIVFGMYGFGVENGTVHALPTIYAKIGIPMVGADPESDPTTDPSLPVYAQLQWQIDHFECGIPEAPIDGKQYARQDGAWAEVQGGGGQGWTATQITLLETVFANLKYVDDSTGQTAAAALIASLRGGEPPEEPIEITFDGTKAVISGLGNTAITYSGTTAKIGYMPL